MPIFTVAWLYLYIFGALTIAGGVFGYVRAKSRVSLIAGWLTGALLVLSATLVGHGGRDGLFLGLAISSSLAVHFLRVFVRSRKVMPAGVMAALSVFGCAVTILALTT
jgi:uncharacterized membrane protein (UPF0136 family)